MWCKRCPDMLVLLASVVLLGVAGIASANKQGGGGETARHPCPSLCPGPNGFYPTSCKTYGGQQICISVP